MNRKIFTLLAGALMLFSTAFYANARSVAESSVGDLVKTLPRGASLGMYHIQIDSICLPDYVVFGPTYPGSHLLYPGASTTGRSVWIPATFDGALAADVAKTKYFQYLGNGLSADAYECTNVANNLNDTLILSVTEGGYVAMISASDLRDSLSKEDGGASLIDLQATMWCIDVQEDAKSPQWPMYHFTNKVYGQDLDWKEQDLTMLDGNNKGWMYSPSYDDGQLKNKMSFSREVDNQKGQRLVIVAQLKDGKPTGLLQTKSVNTDVYVADTVTGMLKFSIVKISPFVMTAEDFNSQLGNTDGNNKVQLSFDPEPIQENYFGYKLRAVESGTSAAAKLGYLNVQVFDENDVSMGYIANSNKGRSDTEKYNNKFGTEYLNLLVKNGSKTNDEGDYNYSYRFVYFPSEDSLVINAYYVSHDQHDNYASNNYTDGGAYLSDKSQTPPLNGYYYGLYSDTIHDYLTVILEDVNGLNGASSLLTIGKHPANVRIYFGINSCQENILDAWQAPKGVYTIWDDRGRCLGVRIYNGSYSPQWMELLEGECPDRIPSYQWVVEHSESSSNRINIHNREFGGNLGSSFVDIKNILVKRKATQIFKPQQGQFAYDPIILDLVKRFGYEPIVDGFVSGRLIPAIGPEECVIKSESGFRPVTNEYVSNEYLGYKHFYVNSDATSVSYGKSEDIGDEKGMDYNAFAFNYLYYDTEKGYIDTQSEYNDTLLHVSTTGKKTAFQFLLGSNIRKNDPKYTEETFGYPEKAWPTSVVIEDKDPAYIFPPYTQEKVPVLKRYYYELKVADFYNYRDGLAEEFVVLKGAAADGSDRKNKLKYGLADVYAEEEPFKFANLYLRESLFLVRESSTNEERSKADPTRRIFYTLLDRIEQSQLKTVTAEGFEVSDTLMGSDGTTKYNLVMVKVEDAKPSFLKAQGKTVSSARASVFALENINYPLYRRLRSTRDDGATAEGDGVDPSKTATALDAPKTLRIYRHANPNHFLHEDALSDVAYNYGINFLGHSNSVQNPEEYAADGTVKYNYHFFIDTAYINRGTGWIKPQYLIAVGQKVVKAQTISGSIICEGDVPSTRTIKPYVIGRYLVNATDSAREIGSNGTDSHPVRDKRYIYRGSWDRLVFVPAIHVDDRLYLIDEMRQNGITEDLYTITAPDGEKYVDASLLRDLTAKWERQPTTQTNSKLGVFYDFGKWNNYHNDVSFSLRFTHPDVTNPKENGDDSSTNEDKRFYIESETTDRALVGSRKIAPVRGGWIKLENFVPVLSRTAYADNIKNAEVFNVALPTDWQGGVATSNEGVASKFSVVAGTDEIIILNAADKRVTVTNLLGQTLVNKALKGDNEKISVAKGIVIVNVEGEKAVKAIVK